MTTNGLLLADKVKRLKEAGLDSVNISLDSFKPTRFKTITGTDGLEKVRDSIDSSERRIKSKNKYSYSQGLE